MVKSSKSDGRIDLPEVNAVVKAIDLVRKKNKGQYLDNIHDMNVDVTNLRNLGLAWTRAAKLWPRLLLAPGSHSWSMKIVLKTSVDES